MKKWTFTSIERKLHVVTLVSQVSDRTEWYLLGPTEKISCTVDSDMLNQTDIQTGCLNRNKRRLIGHFRVPKTLTFKMRLGAQPFLWKWVLLAWEWKIISRSKDEHLPSFGNRGPGELGNGLLQVFTLNKNQSILRIAREQNLSHSIFTCYHYSTNNLLK